MGLDVNRELENGILASPIIMPHPNNPPPPTSTPTPSPTHTTRSRSFEINSRYPFSRFEKAVFKINDFYQKNSQSISVVSLLSIIEVYYQ